MEIAQFFVFNAIRTFNRHHTFTFFISCLFPAFFNTFYLFLCYLLKWPNFRFNAIPKFNRLHTFTSYQPKKNLKKIHKHAHIHLFVFFFFCLFLTIITGCTPFHGILYKMHISTGFPFKPLSTKTGLIWSLHSIFLWSIKNHSCYGICLIVVYEVYLLPLIISFVYTSKV